MPESQPSVDRWVVVNEADHIIVGGPYMWDGVTEWQPPQQGRLMTEADAFAAGHTYPTQEDQP